jgi:D-threo-aldose 1-dehydrogenase
MTESFASTQLAPRPLGRTGLHVTPICLGCAPLGDMPDTFGYGVSEDQARAVLRRAFEGPFNFLDTAAAYGDGESERRIGLVLRELGGVPDGFVVGTKADRDLATRDFSGDQARRSVERSLRLLGLDRLPLVFLHDPEYALQPFEAIMAPGGAVDALLRLKEEGVIEHVGIAGGPIDLLIRYVETGRFEAVISHNRYTLLHQGAAALFDVASRAGVAVLNAAPYASGLLAKGPAAYPRYAYHEAPADVLDRARRMAEVCSDYGVPLAAAALQFSLRDPRISSTIVGMSRPERVDETLRLAAHPIPEQLWPRLEALGDLTEDPQCDVEAALRSAGRPARAS